MSTNVQRPTKLMDNPYHGVLEETCETQPDALVNQKAGNEEVDGEEIDNRHICSYQA